MKSIVLLSGPVGAGKTTVARELMNLSSGEVVYIEGDIFWSFIAKSEGGRVHKNFRTIMTSMTAAAVPYALAGFEVIVDFSIPPWFLDTARKIVERREIPLDFVVVRPSEGVCAARAEQRLEGRITDYGAYRDLYSTFDEAEHYMIADDACDAVEIATRIRAGLDAGTFRVRP